MIHHHNETARWRCVVAYPPTWLKELCMTSYGIWKVQSYLAGPDEVQPQSIGCLSDTWFHIANCFGLDENTNKQRRRVRVCRPENHVLRAKLEHSRFPSRIREAVTIRGVFIAHLSWRKSCPDDSILSLSTCLVRFMEQRTWTDGRVLIRTHVSIALLLTLYHSHWKGNLRITTTSYVLDLRKHPPKCFSRFPVPG